MLPARDITSCCWGGDSYDELFVTSAVPTGLSEESLQRDHAHAGSVFRITGLGVKGRPGNIYMG